MIDIYYQDPDIIVAIKPIGIESEREMPGFLTMQLGSAVFPVHRLDQAVGGLMIFARSPEIAGRLFEQMQSGALQKEYLAVVPKRDILQEGRFEDLLFFDRVHRKSFIVKQQRHGVRYAALRYRIEQSSKQHNLVRIFLETGRTHQIRVQFASRKMPLFGDRKYGSRDEHCPIALWSTRLCFRHPQTDELLDFTSPMPSFYPWSQFE